MVVMIYRSEELGNVKNYRFDIKKLSQKIIIQRFIANFATS